MYNIWYKTMSVGNISRIFNGAFIPTNDTHVNPEQGFLDALTEFGLRVDHLEYATIVRVATDEDTRGKKSGWYIYHPDGIAGGIYGDWRRGETREWWSRNSSEVSPVERMQMQMKRDASMRARDAEYERAANNAAEILASTPPASDDHPYLVTKNVKAHGDIRVSDGKLLIPARNAAGDLTTIQTIDAAGGKLFYKGARVRGSWFTIPSSGGNGNVYVTEGYATGATVHEATGCEVIVAFDAGNMIAIARDIRARYPGPLIFAADNDRFNKENRGVKSASTAAQSVGATYIYPQFVNESSGTDFNDLAIAEGIEVVRAQIAPVASPFPFSRVDTLEIREIDWLIEGYLERESMNLFFGEPGCGKSFIAISMACCIATGTPWFGRKVNKGPVIYIAGEGHNGLARRFKAWDKANNVSLVNAPLFKSHRAAQLTEAEWALKVYESIEALRLPSIAAVFVDTLARNFGGDENSTQDMNRYIEHLDVLMKKYRCAVNSIHHSGKASPGQARGSTALRGAVDSEYSVEIDPTSHIIVMTNKKMKDGDTPAEIRFGIKKVGLGIMGNDGEEIMGATLESVDLSEFLANIESKQEYMGKNQRKCLTALEGLVYARRGQVITGDDWRDACADAGVDRNRFKESRDALVDRKIVSIIGNEVKLSTGKDASESASESL